MKFLIKSLVFFFLVIGLTYSIGIFPIWDDTQITDTDLLLPTQNPIADEDNIYTALPNLAASGKDELIAITELKKWFLGLGDGNFIASTSVASTTDLVTKFELALEKQTFYCPATAVSEFDLEMDKCSLHNLRDLALLVGSHVEFYALAGDTTKAVQLNTALLRFGNQILTQKYPLMVDYVVGLAIIKIGFDALETINLTEAEAGALRMQYFPTSDSLAVAMQYKYMYMKSIFLSNVGAGINTYTMQTNRSINRLAELTRINIATIPCDNMPERTLLSQKKDQLEFSDKYTYIKPNSIGNMYVASLFSPEDSISELYCQLDMRAGVTRGL